MNDQDKINEFLKKMGMENLPEREREELFKKMSELMMKRIFVAVVDRLDEDGREQFVKMIEEEKNPEEIEEFLKSRIENHEKLMEEIAQEVEKEMIEAGSVSEQDKITKE